MYNSNISKSILVKLLGLSLILCSCQSRTNSTPERPNVLFICVDDLRPELGCYGKSHIKSPYIDQLASNGSVFTSHFVTVPTCGASRHSLITGLLPRTQQHLSNNVSEKLLSDLPEREMPETFIHHLRRNGYYTVGIGKISHFPEGRPYGYMDSVSSELELPYSWDEMLLDYGKWGTGWNAFFGYADGTNRNGMDKNVKPYESADVPDEGYPDGLTANLAIKKLKELKQKDQPFFLGVGFFKPHLPFNAPKKYWDLYEEAEIPLTPSPDIPDNVNLASLHNSGEFNQYKLGDEKASLEKPVSEAYERKLRHAYFASVSYIDAQIGKLVNELKQLELDQNTIIVLWGDHGWHLGDDRVWGKHTIFDWSLNSPLIIVDPRKAKGQSVNNVVSTVDIYPTLMELCDVAMPFETDGKSLVPLIKDARTKWDGISYSYYLSGVSLRTDRYRLTKYLRDEKPDIELYDHETDPYERKNIANERSGTVESLMPLWRNGDTGLYKK